MSISAYYENNVAENTIRGLTAIIPWQIQIGSRRQLAPFQYKDRLSSFFLYNENTHSGKTTSLYWHDQFVSLYFMLFSSGPKSNSFRVHLFSQHD